MKPKGFYFKLFLFAITVSCVREDIIDENLPEFQQKMVVYCLLTPGDSIYAIITKSNPVSNTVLKPEDFYVFNARVYIEDSQGNRIELKKSSVHTPVYVASQANFKIEPGESYHFEAEAEGLPSVKAKTTVPENNLVWDETKWSDILIPDEYISIDGVEVNCNWTIPDDFSNGYLVYLRRTTEILENEDWVESEFDQQESSSDLKTIGNKGIYINQFEKINYSEIYVTCSFPLNICTVDSFGEVNSKLKRLELHLITTDPYLTSYNHSTEIYSDIWFSKGSFLSQYKGIIPEYTNIEGGLGVFGSYLSDKTIFNIQ